MAHASATSEFSLPAPATKDELHRHLLSLYVMEYRTVSFMTSNEVALRLLPRPDETAGLPFFHMDVRPDDFALTYDDIKSSEFVMAMDRMYDYAYFGIEDASYESMEDETSFTWAAALVSDWSDSHVAETCDAYGQGNLNAARICKQIAETANARAVLEGGEGFFPFGHRGAAKGDAWYLTDDLSVRQLALLAGMEEMTIRSAANPKRANALQTYSNEKGATRIKPEVAKAWLIAKGRYVTPKRQWGGEELDLVKRSFRSADEALEAISARFTANMTRLDESAKARMLSELKKAGIAVEKTIFGEPVLALDPEHLSDTRLMQYLAIALDLSPDLFVLRIREGLAKDNLNRVLREIREVIESDDSQH